MAFSFSRAQKRGTWQIGAGANGTLFFTASNNGNFIKPIIADSPNTVNSQGIQWSVGASLERMINKNIFVGSGLYFSQFQTSTFNRSRIGHYSFYGLVNENANQFEYASMDLIYTVRNYLAVPLEIRFEPPSPAERFGFYVKAAIVTQFALGKSLTTIRMSDSSAYNGSINLPRHFANTRDVFFGGNVGLGVRIGKPEDFNMRMELGFPIPFTNTLGPYSLHEGIVFGGSFYYPLGKRIKHAK
jgi:hypothetical protein